VEYRKSLQRELLASGRSRVGTVYMGSEGLKPAASSQHDDRHPNLIVCADQPQQPRVLHQLVMAHISLVS